MLLLEFSYYLTDNMFGESQILIGTKISPAALRQGAGASSTKVSMETAWAGTFKSMATITQQANANYTWFFFSQLWPTSDFLAAVWTIPSKTKNQTRTTSTCGTKPIDFKQGCTEFLNFGRSVVSRSYSAILSSKNQKLSSVALQLQVWLLAPSTESRLHVCG